MPLPVRNQLKTGQRPVQQQVKAYKEGDILFEEGSAGKELFIIQEGKVSIYKNTPDGRVELAVVEKGGIIGEMSLLDNLPRSATVQAHELTKALIINQASFDKIMEDIPVWLQSIIKIVVSRLRDANKRVDQTVLRDKERGLAHLIRLLLISCKKQVGSCSAVEHELLTVEAFFVCRLRKKEIVKYIGFLEKRGLIRIFKDKDKDNSEWVLVKEPDVLELFDEYLYLKGQKQTFKEISIPEEAITALKNIAYIAQKSGKETEEGTAILKSAVLKDISGKDAGRLDQYLIDLRRRNLVNISPSGTDMVIIFKKENLRRIIKIKEWMLRFSMELS